MTVALEAEKEIADCGVILLEKLTPYSEIAETIKSLVSPDTRIVFLEEGIKNGGASMILSALLDNRCGIAAIDGTFDTGKNSGNVFDDYGIGKNDVIRTFGELNGN